LEFCLQQGGSFFTTIFPEALENFHNTSVDAKPLGIWNFACGKAALFQQPFFQKRWKIFKTHPLMLNLQAFGILLIAKRLFFNDHFSRSAGKFFSD